MHARGIRASKVWSLKCGMRVYIMYFVCMLMNTHKMRTQHFIVYAPSVKNRIRLYARTRSYKTHAYTCIHQHHNVFRCKNIRSLLLTDSFYRVSTQANTLTHTVLCCDMDLFRFFVSIFIQRVQMLSFSPFSCALLLFSSFRIDIM